MFCAYTAEHGSGRVPTTQVVDDVHLGRWVSRQRATHRRGTLPADRAAALQRLPGWEWALQS